MFQLARIQRETYYTWPENQSEPILRYLGKYRLIIHHRAHRVEQGCTVLIKGQRSFRQRKTPLCIFDHPTCEPFCESHEARSYRGRFHRCWWTWFRLLQFGLSKSIQPDLSFQNIMKNLFNLFLSKIWISNTH